MPGGNRWGAPAPVLGSMDWMSRGKCRGSQANFFPTFTGKKESPAIREAKAVCSTCPVKAECLAFALDAQERDGIWGGMTPDERRKPIDS